MTFFSFYINVARFMYGIKVSAIALPSASEILPMNFCGVIVM